MKTKCVICRTYPPAMSLSEGLAVQAEDLRRWQQRLNVDCNLALANEADIRNCHLDPEENCGHDVWRGQQLSAFVQNWRPQ